MKYTAMLESLVIMTLLFSLVMPSLTVKSNGYLHLQRMPTIVAHRGASGDIPENTIAAFDRALEMKADYIEMDVQRSKDGELVVIHDRTVDRTTNGTGLVKNLTLKQLKSLDAGNWKGEKFTGERISTFEEILNRYHKRIGMIIEIKYPELYPEIEEQIAQTLRKTNLDQPQRDRIIIQSFNDASMKKMNQLLPEVPIGILTKDKKDTSAHSLKDFSSYADYFNPNIKIVNKEIVEQAYAYGMKVFPWTVRSHAAAEFVLNLNVSAVITDYPQYIH